MTVVRIYDKAFMELGLSADFVSLSFRCRFREAGDCTLVLPVGSKGVGLLTPDGYVKVPTGEFFRIMSVETDERNNTVSAKCRGLLSLFEGTVFPEEYSRSGGVSGIISSLVRESRTNLPLPISFGSMEGNGVVRLSSGRSVLYDDLVSLCYLGGVGMSLDYNGTGLVFSSYLPRDRRAGSADPVTASGKLGTFQAQNSSWDYSSYKNVAVVSGAEKEDGTRYTAVVRSDGLSFTDFPDRDHFDRQTLVNFTAPVRPYMFENAAGLLELDEDLYLSAMEAAGAAVLGRCRPKMLLTGVVGDKSLRPGDVVTLVDSSTGISGDAVTESVEYRYDNGGFCVTAEISAVAQ